MKTENKKSRRGGSRKKINKGDNQNNASEYQCESIVVNPFINEIKNDSGADYDNDAGKIQWFQNQNEKENNIYCQEQKIPEFRSLIQGRPPVYVLHILTQ